MAWTFSVLVVANVTATSDELVAALSERAQHDKCRFFLVVPRAGGDRGMLGDALVKLREAGLEVEGAIGDPDPLTAVAETYDPQQFDEIVISTLPTGVSKWLQVDLPHRVERTTGAPVTHVIAEPPRPEPRVEHVEKRDGYGVLEPFRAL
jgi:hypothetical protein